MEDNMKKIELLAPAGDLNRLKLAYLYGADACYIGGKDYSLRANANNFSNEEIKEACEFAHKLNKKVYVTVNIVFQNEDFDGLVKYLKELEKSGVDAIIVSDPSVINIIKRNHINLNIHISTQTSTSNVETVNFWKSYGVERVVLSRELSKEEIRELASTYDLKAANKPSSPCLATRFPYNTLLNYEEMRKVEKIEDYLHTLGFYNVRARIHDDLVRLEIDQDAFMKCMDKRQEIVLFIKELGYDYVTLDLEGFRSGSQDIKLEEK